MVFKIPKGKWTFTGGAVRERQKLATAILVWKINFHKQKLLKQVDFMNWQVTAQNLHKLHVLWPYWLQQDNICYKQLSHPVHELAWLLYDLPKRNLFHTHTLATLLDKLYDLGLVLMHSLLARSQRCPKCLVLLHCSLPTVLLKLRMKQHLQAALAFQELSQVPLVTNPTFLVRCSMEDWVDLSKIKQ
ncbi:U3 small nucleolar ribonucleoprotein protein IMP3-like [Pipistrellus kuhlii]|uniref:U3 small nucleolar ribonucleoprotein protein IMP3-like n=1 Tax=Pipistrellus kuhlii TaxID=59472 RepID=UPI00174F72B5|nr:U3 small nucleolar ribonucleoprotein protein IMP3-like [Pipistrellus kuhlii]